MSGLQIFNAHPNLYWGDSSYSKHPAILTVTTGEKETGGEIGLTRVFGHNFNTSGILGLSREDGDLIERAFPAWITIPSNQWLAMGRRWHLFFAWVLVINGIVYVVHSVLSRHFSSDLAPTRGDWRSIGRSVLDHLRLRHPLGEAARHYNILQKLTYLVVIFVLLPFMVLTGCAMSPRLDSLAGGWVDLLGGRQSSRTLHFIVAWTLVLFVLIHVFEVIVSGLWNNIRSMITGRYKVQPQPVEMEVGHGRS
jgi:thiosulfate reductase cytochrome b subunit